MKLEKIAYAGFGFLLIIMSCFSILSTMSISALQKIPQIGILKAIGFNSFDIKKIFFYFSFISGLIGVINGVSIILIIQLIENNFPFINIIFGDYPFLEFSIYIDFYTINYKCKDILDFLIFASQYLYHTFQNY